MDRSERIEGVNMELNVYSVSRHEWFGTSANQSRRDGIRKPGT